MFFSLNLPWINHYHQGLQKPANNDELKTYQTRILEFLIYLTASILIFENLKIVFFNIGEMMTLVLDFMILKAKIRFSRKRNVIEGHSGGTDCLTYLQNCEYNRRFSEVSVIS